MGLADNKCKCDRKYNSMELHDLPYPHINWGYCKCNEENCVDPCKFIENGNFCNLAPCVEIKWGDSAQDQLETDDVEVLCIVFKNCFKGITFEDVEIVNIFITDNTNNNNPPINLPDGTPSVMIKPECKICFGDLKPCTKPHGPHLVEREAVLITRGANDGPYTLHIIFKYKICGHICERRADFSFFLIPS